jgi:ABC-type polysaccharide/polyol phosphate transport system ATPase subunit
VSVALRPGELVLEDATRSFALTHERSRTLKELLVRRGRRQRRSSVKALDGVDLRIEPGEAVGMVGRNGAGKTSTCAAWRESCPWTPAARSAVGGW